MRTNFSQDSVVLFAMEIILTFLAVYETENALIPSSTFPARGHFVWPWLFCAKDKLVRSVKDTIDAQDECFHNLAFGNLRLNDMGLKVKAGSEWAIVQSDLSLFYPKMTVLLQFSENADPLCVCPQSFSIIAPLVDVFFFFLQVELSISLSPACHGFRISAALYFAFEFLWRGHSWTPFKLENRNTREIRLLLKCCSPKRHESSSRILMWILMT